MEEEKITHGGARAGSGRKKGGTNKGERKSGRIVVTCYENEAEMIKRLADEAGKTVSQFVVDCVKSMQ